MLDADTVAAFAPLEVRVPEKFEVDLGCDPGCRYLGFFPDPSGEHLVAGNGVSEEAIDERVWEAWLGAPRVRVRIEKAMTGDEWSLLLDTRSRQLYCGNELAVKDFLYQHRSLGADHPAHKIRKRVSLERNS